MEIRTKDSATGLLVWGIAAVLVMTVMLSMLAGMVMDVDIIDGFMKHLPFSSP